MSNQTTFDTGADALLSAIKHASALHQAACDASDLDAMEATAETLGRLYLAKAAGLRVRDTMGVVVRGGRT